MDGFASNSASMEVNNVKSTLYNASPAFILLDTQILAQAPERMLWAGGWAIWRPSTAPCANGASPTSSSANTTAKK